MKKLTILTCCVAFLGTSAAFAEGTRDEKRAENFAAHKAEVISSLNKEKSIIDSTISCFNSAKVKEDAKKCHDQRKSSMDALREERKNNRKERIEDRAEKLQEKSEQLKEKAAKKVEKKINSAE